MMRNSISFPITALLLCLLFKELDTLLTWDLNPTVDHKKIEIEGKYVAIQLEGNHPDNMNYTKKAKSYANYTFDQKCDLGLEFGLGFQSYTPYVNMGVIDATKSTVLSGIFPHVLNEAMKFCCPKSKVGYARALSSLQEVEKHVGKSDEVDISFPVNGQEGKQSTQFKDFPFIPIVTAPRIVILVPDKLYKDRNNRTQVLMKTIFNTWPMLIFIIVSACLAGLCVWVLDKHKNYEQFPQHFFVGAWEGIWWAFVTMTTVGYGDRSPKSILARAFCIMWILLGITLISLFTGLVSAALNASSTPVFNIAGAKIGAVSGSVEYQVGVGLNAEMKSFKNHLDVFTNLVNDASQKKNPLHAAMLDNFILSASASEGFLQRVPLRIEREIEYPVTYGIVLAENSTKTTKCFRKYMRHHPQEVFEIIAENLVPVKNPTDDVRKEVEAAEKPFYEEGVFKTLVWVEGGLLIAALIIGVLWETLSRNRNSALYKFLGKFRRKGPKFVETINLESELQTLLQEYDDYHSKWIDRVKTIYNQRQ